eukprot:6437187-Amphidinium_carterae.1
MDWVASVIPNSRYARRYMTTWRIRSRVAPPLKAIRMTMDDMICQVHFQQIQRPQLANLILGHRQPVAV